jgi:hypothetical protein
MDEARAVRTVGGFDQLYDLDCKGPRGLTSQAGWGLQLGRRALPPAI